MTDDRPRKLPDDLEDVFAALGMLTEPVEGSDRMFVITRGGRRVTAGDEAILRAWAEHARAALGESP